MHYPIRGVLSQPELEAVHRHFEASRVVDGRATASGAAADVKRNLQVDTGSASHREMAQIVGQALGRHPELSALAFPHRLATPTFARYEPGMEYGAHVDSPFLGGGTIRADISITVFLSPPESYDGGELELDLAGNRIQVKLPAGDAFIYPTTYLHRVVPVTRGVRLVAVSWIQSHLPDERQRRIVVDLNRVKQALENDPERRAEADLMRGATFNLIRLWWDA